MCRNYHSFQISVIATYALEGETGKGNNLRQSVCVCVCRKLQGKASDAITQQQMSAAGPQVSVMN